MAERQRQREAESERQREKESESQLFGRLSLIFSLPQLLWDCSPRLCLGLAGTPMPLIIPIGDVDCQLGPSFSSATSQKDRYKIELLDRCGLEMNEVKQKMQ